MSKAARAPCTVACNGLPATSGGSWDAREISIKLGTGQQASSGQQRWLLQLRQAPHPHRAPGRGPACPPPARTLGRAPSAQGKTPGAAPSEPPRCFHPPFGRCGAARCARGAGWRVASAGREGAAAAAPGPPAERAKAAWPQCIQQQDSACQLRAWWQLYFEAKQAEHIPVVHLHLPPLSSRQPCKASHQVNAGRV